MIECQVQVTNRAHDHLAIYHCGNFSDAANSKYSCFGQVQQRVEVFDVVRTEVRYRKSAAGHLVDRKTVGFHLAGEIAHFLCDLKQRLLIGVLYYGHEKAVWNRHRNSNIYLPENPELVANKMGVGSWSLFQRPGDGGDHEVLVLGTQLVLSPLADQFTLERNRVCYIGVCRQRHGGNSGALCHTAGDYSTQSGQFDNFLHWDDRFRQGDSNTSRGWNSGAGTRFCGSDVVFRDSSAWPCAGHACEVNAHFFGQPARPGRNDLLAIP